MTIISRGGDNPPPDTAITDAAHNAVAVAAVAYQQELARLRYVLQLAHSHGLGELQIVAASGLPASFVHRLLGEVT